MIFNKKALLTLAVSAATLLSTTAQAEFSANVAAGSNYIWRGVTQTEDNAAVSGGLDFAAKNGLYVGTWASNVDFGDDAGTEVDIYGGFSKELDSGFSYDIGAIRYLYTGAASGSNFTEGYLNLGFGGVGLSLNNDFENDNFYVSLGYEGETAKGLGYGIKVGDYSFDDSTGDYSHVQLSLSKNDFTFAIDKTDQDDDAGDARVTVSYSKSFDL